MLDLYLIQTPVPDNDPAADTELATDIEPAPDTDLAPDAQHVPDTNTCT